ncbi:ATP-binding protein [Streptomyces sp. TRM49041]|uniref:AAA family ATPase n=1 Tax=Streptomyces sp. TRM49041 TaxID=2603216 RepID=UPI0021CD05AD|nr:ATP-binding protein [Streptomyces sp. TRM49041]
MPLETPEWDRVAVWAQEYLLDSVDPRAQLGQAGFSAEFVGTLPLTSVSAHNAHVLVLACRRTIGRQVDLLRALVVEDRLRNLPDVRDAQEYLDRLEKDAEAHRSQDVFRASLLRGGSEVFLDREDLRETLRTFVRDTHKSVLLVDGEPASGRSYTYSFIRHIGQHHGFRPARIMLGPTTTAGKVVRRLATFVSDPHAGIAPPVPTDLNDLLPTLDEAVHSVVRHATGAEDVFWFVLDDCDRLDPGSDVWDLISQLALAIFEQEPLHREQAPRLVLLGYGPSMRQLPHDLRHSLSWDRARIAGADDIRAFFDRYVHERPPASLAGLAAEEREEALAGLAEVAVEEVLAAIGDSGSGRGDGDTYMRRLCTAVEGAVRVYPSEEVPGPASGPASEHAPGHASGPVPGHAPGHAADHAGPRELFRVRLRQELRPSAGPADAVSGARRGYRQAACLLTSFDPKKLRLPGEREPTGRAVTELAADCTATGMADRMEWALTPEVREEALRSLAGPEEALRVLEHNIGASPEEQGPERVCLNGLRGEAPHTSGADTEELSDILQAVLWLSLVPGMSGQPDPGAVRHELELARILQPLERLVQAPFVGREEQLAELRRYLGDSAGGTAAGRAAAPPVVVHGPGGMGKSTLLAHFLLDSLRTGEGGNECGGVRTFPFPFTYIDFERPTLSVHEPVTLVAETARQLGIQYPAFRAELDALADECQEAARGQRADEERVIELNRLAATRAGPGRLSSQQFLVMASERESALFRRVGEVLRRAVAPGDPPFVVVIDSFEEAQDRGSPALGRIWAAFLALHEVYPRLRVVISGRAPVGHPAAGALPREIELHDLDPEASVALLLSSGVADPELARVLAERVGGHPLSLRLAARAAALAGGDAASLRELIGSLPARRRDFFRRVDQMLVQGILYERILQHIPDADVRRLAHAGLVLRLITPEVVREVLAGPCGVAVPGPEKARRLFDALSRLDLVEPAAGPESVRVRSDVRAIMLRLADRDPASVSDEVERSAVAYYAGRDGLQARAEEIYHRLRLDEDPRTVEGRWLPGVERLLAGAQDELSPRAAALLTAHRHGERASDLVMAEADQEDWERIAAREVEDLLAQGFTEEALARLAERRPWTPCSPLHALLAEALSRAGRLAEARRVASDAIEPALLSRCAERELELLLLSARLSEEDGDLDSADRDLRLAEDVAIGLGQDLEAMGALLARARLDGSAEVPDREADTRLARRLRQVPDAVLADQPLLVRAVASQVYTLDARALDHAVDLVGLPEGDEVLETLGEALRRAVVQDQALLRPLMGILQRAAGAGDTTARPAGPVGRDVPPPPVPAPGTRTTAGDGAAPGPSAPVTGPTGRSAARAAETPTGAGRPAEGPPPGPPTTAEGFGVAPPAPAPAGPGAGAEPAEPAERLRLPRSAPPPGATPPPGPASRVGATPLRPSPPPPPATPASLSAPVPPTPSGSPSDVTGILRLARERGTLDDLARRLLVLRDESGEIAAGVAAALRAGGEGGEVG